MRIFADENIQEPTISFLEGSPPKVVCVQMGNCSTLDLENVLRNRYPEISDFAANEDESFMMLS